MDRSGVSPYLTRWYLRGRPTMPPGPFHEPFDAHGNPFEEAVFPDGASVYLHKIHRSDTELELHNHPWRWARALILAGGYFEERRDRHDTVRGWRRRPGDVVTIDADTYHRVVLSPCDACKATGALRKQVKTVEGFAPWVEPCPVCKGSRCAPSWSLFVCGPKHGASWRFWNRETGESWPWRDFIFGHVRNPDRPRVSDVGGFDANDRANAMREAAD
jgi:hypothetical protein